MTYLKEKKKATVLITVIMFILWLTTFFGKFTEIDPSTLLLLDNLQFTIIGLSIFVSFIHFEDIFYTIVLLLFLPFSFSHEFDVLSIPNGLLIIVAFIILGLIIRLFKFPFKFKKGKFFYGLICLWISLILGGIFIKNPYYLLQLGLCIFGGLLFVVIYEYLVSNIKNYDFSLIAVMMSCLGGYILLQIFSSYLLNNDFYDTFMNRGIALGWAPSPNNVGMCLLFTVPFPIYLLINSKNLKNVVICTIYILSLVMGIFLTTSRGAIGVIGLYSLPILVVALVKLFKTNKKFGWTVLSISLFSLIAVVGGAFIIDSPEHPIIKTFQEMIIKGFRFNTLNGRVNIYKVYSKMFLDKPIFGYGLLYSLTFNVESFHPPVYFEWAHDTFLQMAFWGGIVGVIGMIVHLFEKYYGCLKNINWEKYTLLCGFILPGTYGLFDVSYFLLSYSVILLVLLILCNDHFEKVEYSKFFKKILKK